MVVQDGGAGLSLPGANLPRCGYKTAPAGGARRSRLLDTEPISMLTLSRVGLALLALGTVTCLRQNIDPKLREVIERLPVPGSGVKFNREIPADELRDHRGECFSFNNGQFYQVGESWRIEGVCAKATCLSKPLDQRKTFFQLLEKVEDCGPRFNATVVTECKYTREEDLAKAFPACCPTFECDASFDARDLLLPDEGPQEAVSEEPAAASPSASPSASSSASPSASSSAGPSASPSASPSAGPSASPSASPAQ